MGAFSDSIRKEISIPLLGRDGGVDGSGALVLGAMHYAATTGPVISFHPGEGSILDIWRI